MPRDIVPTREGPRKEISTPQVAKGRPWTGPRSREYRQVPQAEAWARDFDAAKREMERLNIAQAIDFLKTMPIGLLELHLLAEEATQNRPSVIQMFPKPGARARNRYTPAAVGA